MLIAEISGGTIATRQVMPCSPMSPQQLVGHLADLGVTMLVCGGINCQHEAMLSTRGITVIRGIAAEAEEALQALAANALEPGAPMPRRCGRRRGRCCPPWQDAS